jgi:hypothetical protein
MHPARGKCPCVEEKALGGCQKRTEGVTLMKKILALLLVLAVAQVASAGFMISVNGVPNPTAPVVLAPSGHATIDIHGVGNTGATTELYLVCQGPGMLAGGTIVYPGTFPVPCEISTKSAAAYEAGWEGWLWGGEVGETGFGLLGVTWATYAVIGSTVNPQPLLNGLLADGIDFHCEAVGPVTLSLWSFGETYVLYDTQEIIQTPEPITMSLLGLGGLALIRRRHA